MSENSHIENNLFNLTTGTKISITSLTYLYSKGILKKEEKQTLKCELDRGGDIRASDLLYSYIIEKNLTPEIYDEIIAGFEKGGSTGAAYILRKARDNDNERVRKSTNQPNKISSDLPNTSSSTSSESSNPTGHSPVQLSLNWQQQHIYNNLNVLAAHTNYDAELLEQLRIDGILTDEQFKKLREGNVDSAQVYYDILLQKSLAFDKLYKKLWQSGQVIPAQILQEADLLTRLDREISPIVGGLDKESRTRYDFVDKVDFVKDVTPLASSKQPLVVKRPQTKMSLEDKYRLPSTKKGYVLIINIYKFNNGEIRKGSEHDGFYMTELWTQLGYEVYTDQHFKSAETKRFTKTDIQNLIERFKEKCQVEKPASIVVFVGSHGGWDEICTSDNDSLSVYKGIINQFSHEECPALEGRPKIFLINTCQVFRQGYDKEVEKVEERNFPDIIHRAPTNDMHILTSQVPGYLANRDFYKGSHFVYCLTYVIKEYAKEYSFREMIDMTRQLMERIDATEKAKPGQTLSSTDYGLKKLYFYMEPEDDDNSAKSTLKLFGAGRILQNGILSIQGLILAILVVIMAYFINQSLNPNNAKSRGYLQ